MKFNVDTGISRFGFKFTYAGILLIILAVIMLAGISMLFHVYHATTIWQGLIVSNFLLPLCICIFFYGLITEKTIIERLLSSRLFILLGKSSYAFYLISAGFIAFTVEKYITGNLFVLLVILLLISIILYFFIERISRELLLKIFNKKNRVRSEAGR